MQTFRLYARIRARRCAKWIRTKIDEEIENESDFLFWAKTKAHMATTTDCIVAAQFFSEDQQGPSSVTACLMSQIWLCKYAFDNQ